MTKTTITPAIALNTLVGWSLEGYDYIYGVPVSGMIPAMMLAGEGSGVPLILTWSGLLKALEDGKQVLLVDDIKDSGTTEKKIKKLLKKWKGQISFKYIVDKTKDPSIGWVETFWEADKAIFHDEEDDELRAQQKLR